MLLDYPCLALPKGLIHIYVGVVEMETGLLCCPSPRFKHLTPQVLGGRLRLEHARDAGPPGVLEAADLGRRVVLRRLALQRQHVDGAARVGQLALERLELGLEVPVANEPGVLAVRVEQGEVRAARGDVGVAGVGAGEQPRQI